MAERVERHFIVIASLVDGQGCPQWGTPKGVFCLWQTDVVWLSVRVPCVCASQSFSQLQPPLAE